MSRHNVVSNSNTDREEGDDMEIIELEDSNDEEIEVMGDIHCIIILKLSLI